MLEVLETGPLATVQDLGRPGLADIGVGVSGAADRGSLRLANRLLGNDEGAAAIEVTFGGLAVRAGRDLTIAVTGAPCPVTVDGRGEGANAVLRVAAGEEVRLGAPPCGLRSYLAVRGGIDVEPVLGSRSTDVMAGIGPAALRVGDTLPVGPAPAAFPVVDLAPVAPPPEDLVLDVVPGPREDWFTGEALEVLLTSVYEVTTESNRVGMRLDGPALTRSRSDELPSEGMVAGALQVPPASKPTLFLADHPVTGGYPVIAVVTSADVDRAAQARPGQRVRFRRAQDRSAKR
ncbi:biotin-dependent carboxyltransferase family protein [Saccharopolyspora erythraea]|uniref:5-oxoprolinase subunit C family protein n=1 Tax=Saccharopolyspora erythraea TaxID=1836 RepID=UPI001BADDCB0|nr:biotin-dependent carboxyltransferase family protein [Saccharopolyspora erythraea]QUH01130.1 biotin-dependent carboxyltransferase family protein [Saccharopolyspora erythraea]